MQKKIPGYLRLMRPANVVTAVADIMAGMAIAGYFNQGDYSLVNAFVLILSTMGLYAGGVVLNDVFDAGLDKVERPERPIPSGLISRREGAWFGVILLVTGIAAALWVSQFSGMLALAIAVFAVMYDKWGKHHPVIGPLNMGLCRGLNLLLGISIIPVMVEQFWFLGIVPVVYIAAITMISRGEVHGGSRTVLYAAMVLYFVVMLAIFYAAFINRTLVATIAFLFLWSIMIFIPLLQAIREPVGKMIGKAVKAGVIALIIMDAAWATAFGQYYLALIILLLLPLSLTLAKAFAVT